ncbi:GNAT family protein [Streptomyces sp. NPDC001941]|uniref:GNAT family N-acetyltransferase n=1 Tax=Streptomyces sp. NPDC001941 TaxID=3154659 RepID=UPI003329F0AB
MSHVPELCGERVRVRELRARDHQVYERLFTHSMLTQYLGVDRMDPRRAQDAFAQCLAQPHIQPRRKYTFAVCAADDDTMAGTIGLLVEDYGSNAMLTGLVMLPDAPALGGGFEAGRLVMAYAFGPLGLHRVWAGHRADHTRMRGVMLAAGLKPEATLRHLFHTQEAWHDVTTYSALAPEWTPQAGVAEQAVLNAHKALQTA